MFLQFWDGWEQPFLFFERSELTPWIMDFNQTCDTLIRPQNFKCVHVFSIFAKFQQNQKAHGQGGHAPAQGLRMKIMGVACEEPIEADVNGLHHGCWEADFGEQAPAAFGDPRTVTLLANAGLMVVIGAWCQAFFDDGMLDIYGYSKKFLGDSLRRRDVNQFI